MVHPLIMPSIITDQDKKLSKVSFHYSLEETQRSFFKVDLASS